MPQSEDKLALDFLKAEIDTLTDIIEQIKNTVTVYETKLEQLIARKKAMENYLNSDNN